MIATYLGFDPDFEKTSILASRRSVLARSAPSASEDEDLDDDDIGMSAQEQHDAGLARAMRRLRAQDESTAPDPMQPAIDASEAALSEMARTRRSRKVSATPSSPIPENPGKKNSGR